MLKLATVFSGIGAIEFALKRLNVDYEVVFACDNGERDVDIDRVNEFEYVKTLQTIKEKKEYVENLYKSKTRKINYMQKSYEENYSDKMKSGYFFQDICLLDGRDFKDEVDLFVGGSPCQSFSSVGFQGGLDDPRGNLFFEYARLVNEIQPKVFIYENVRNLRKHNKGETWSIVENTFKSLGYKISSEVLNAADFGIPQNRRRLFVVGIKEDIDFDFSNLLKKDLKFTLQDFLINNVKEGNFSYNDLGEIIIKEGPGEVSTRYELTPGVLNYVLQGGTKNFYQKPELDLKIARPLLKTMGNHHRAGIDNYITVDKNANRYRQLTEREAHRLMGFTDDYKIVVSRNMAYQQAGNSIVVDVLMNMIKELIRIGALVR